jgi:protease I
MSKMPSVLILVEDGYEDMELMYPKYRLEEAGYRVIVAGPKANQEYVGKHGYPCVSDAVIAAMCSSEFIGVICPGGWAPDKLRRNPKVKQLVAEFAAAGKLVAAICHGGWIPISSDVYRGAHVTGSLGIKDDLVNASAIFEDSDLVVDRHFVSSRKPDDLPAFMKGVLQVLTDQIAKDEKTSSLKLGNG